VLIWYVYPNIGIDDRNQTDLAQDMPGGLNGLKRAVDAFHRRGVKVFLPTKPWDNGTRDHGRDRLGAHRRNRRRVGADGINGDTYNGVPRAFFDACDAAAARWCCSPRSTALGRRGMLIWNVQSWGKKVPTDVMPAVPRWKWLEPRHMINVENRWGRDRNNDLQYIFFNGVGYNAWENVWGIWNQLTPRDAETLRRIATLQRKPSRRCWSARTGALCADAAGRRFRQPLPGRPPDLVDRSSIATNTRSTASSWRAACRGRALLRRLERRGAARRASTDRDAV
jgi:iron(II)-dependent oxidoreductase